MKRDLISHIPLSLLGSISCLCLFVMTFSVPSGFHLWAFTGLAAVISPALAEISPRRRAVALGVAAVVYLATFFAHFSAAKEGFAILTQAVTSRYQIVYQGYGAKVVWSQNADYALLLPFGAVALAVGLWMGGKNRRWLPPVVLTVLIFSLCVAVNSFDTRPERLAAVALVSFWLIMALTGHVRRFRRTGAATALVLLPLVILLAAGAYWGVKPDSWTRSPSQDKVVSAFERDWYRLLRSLGFNIPQDPNNDPGQVTPVPGGVGVDAPPPAWSDQNRQGFDLHTVGPRIDRGETVFRLKATESGPLYLRGYSLGDYDPETGWAAPKAYETPALNELSSVITPNPNYLAFEMLQINGYKSNAAVEIRRVSADTATSLLPYFHTKQILQMWDDENGSNYLLEGNDVRTYDMLTHYQAKYVPYAGDYEEFSDTSPIDPAYQYTSFVNSQYLALPEGYRDKLLPLMEEGGIPATDWYPPNSDRLSIAKKVAAYLAGLAAYDKNASYTPAGEDFVLWFLTESRRGYCIHFATAGVLLCRAAGIPARYVSGFMAEVTQAGEWADVTDERAHAWVEIYLQGFGWVPVEMTPTGRDSPTVTTEPSPTATVTAPSGESTTAPVQQTVPSATDPSGGKAEPKQWDLTWLLWVAGAALLLALIPLQREWRLARHRRQFKGKDLNRSTLYAWHFARRAAKYGGKMPDELRDLAEKARFSRDGVTSAERQEAVTRALALRDGVYASLSRRKKLAMSLWSALK